MSLLHYSTHLRHLEDKPLSEVIATYRRLNPKPKSKAVIIAPVVLPAPVKAPPPPKPIRDIIYIQTLPIECIIRAVTVHFNLSLDEIRSPSKLHTYLMARQALCILLRERTKLTWPQIGARLHRDHTTVMNSVLWAPRREGFELKLAEIREALEKQWGYVPMPIQEGSL